VIEKAGKLYIADIGNTVIRKVAAGTGMIITMAGSGSNRNPSVKSVMGMDSYRAWGQEDCPMG
jgi:hypothetical protein